MPAYYTAESPAAVARLAAAWKGAPIHNEELLAMLLEVAREQVVEYAPAAVATEPSPDVIDGGSPEDPGEGSVDGNPDDVPARYVLAQLRQAQTLWDAGRADPAGDIGPEGFRFTPRPLDKTIRNMIRPQSGVADVF